MAKQLANAEEDWPFRLKVFQESFADGITAVRLNYLGGLASRAENQPDPIRQLLIKKIVCELDEIALQQSTPAPTIEQTVDTSTISPLTELLTHIREHGITPPGSNKSQNTTQAAQPHSQKTIRPDPIPELKSVTYFRKAWSSLSAEQQLTQTLAQAPENAGPMNSRHLVLGALKFMREHSPSYLQGFMSHVDTLIWLEHASPTKSTTERSVTNEGTKKKQTTKRNSAAN